MMTNISLDSWLGMLAILVAVLFGIAGLLMGPKQIKRLRQKQKIGRDGEGMQAGRDINVGR